MKPGEKDNEDQTTTSAGAGSPSNGETPTRAGESASVSPEEPQRRYINLRARLRSLAYAIEQTERLHREIEDCSKACNELWRKEQLSGLTAEEKRRLARLEDFPEEKELVLAGWQIAVSSLFLAVCPKDWAAQGEPTCAWDHAENAADLDPDQEQDFEVGIPSDFMPFWSREALEGRLARLRPQERWLQVGIGQWTNGIVSLDTDEAIKPPGLALELISAKDEADEIE